MFARRPAAASLVALGAAVAGLVGVFSALTPEFASRSDFVRGVLPPGVPAAARVLVLSIGFALIWLSRSLARRKRRAWELAVALVAASAAAHLAKGLDFEEALFSALVLAALWRYRREFSAPGDPATVRPLLQVLVALAALGALTVLRVWDHMDRSELIEEAGGFLAGALAFRGLYLWLRPLAEQVRQGTRERALAERLVREQGRDSLAFFALRRDKSYFFSATGRSFLAYRVVNGSALVTGDPIGEPTEFRELIAEFRRIAQARAWRVAILGASEDQLALYRSLGFRSFYLGDEAIVRPRSFSLEGRAVRKVRQSVNRAKRAGYRVRVIGAAASDERLRAELRRVSADWRGGWPERGFTMAMDCLFAYPEGVIAVAENEEGRVGAFLQLVPSPAGGNYSLATMRRCRSSPNGLMEFLIVETIAWARNRRVSELSLNFSVFAQTLRADAGASLPKRLIRFVLLKLDRFFQLKRLLSFSGKFLPDWRPRYLCVERLSDFPVVGLAYLHAESLLTPPGPWVQSRDLASR